MMIDTSTVGFKLGMMIDTSTVGFKLGMMIDIHLLLGSNLV